MLIGIDLGTTNSLVSCFRNGEPVIIPNRLGQPLTPSVVSIDDSGSILVGATRKEYGLTHPDRSASVFKRAMGTDRKYALGDMEFAPEELSGIVLRSLKEDAEVFLGQSVDEAIISVPAYFDDRQRKATKRAGELAGLKVSRIINEPTASALSYGVGKDGLSEHCMVLDLGGGTFDVTVLEYYMNIMEVYAIAGDNFLGGEDFTDALAGLFVSALPIPAEKLSPSDLRSIRSAADRCKEGFSKSNVSTMTVKLSGEEYERDIEEQDYTEACGDLLARLSRPIERALRDAKVTLGDIDRVILVGGAMKLPLVRKYIRQITGKDPEFTVDPDTAVALGAAIQCAMKERDSEIEEVILTDVCPYTLGTEVVEFNGSFEESGRYLPIIERNTVIPVSRKQTVYTARDDQTSVEVKVLQGESRLARNNLQIGTLSVDVPKAPRGQEAIEITYTYDVNALLEVTVRVISTGEMKKTIIQNEDGTLTREEAEERMKRLSYLKQSPREEEGNKYAMFLADRMYRESSGRQREEIAARIDEFDRILERGTRLEIDSARKKLLEFLKEKDPETGYSKILS
ncbi:MAG: molecular chaperone HscC [Oscillospiraceae bacterium]|nr:molecular chaperone HscC [Oscillospiraceae bacterium]